jgi:hypothetical protein
VSTFKAKDLATYVVETFMFIVYRVATDLSVCAEQLECISATVFHPQHTVLMTGFSFNNIRKAVVYYRTQNISNCILCNLLGLLVTSFIKSD